MGGGEIVSLLDKALEAKVSGRQKKGASNDELELAVAYWKDHVSAAQVLAALGQKAENATSFVDTWAKKALRAGLADGRLTLRLEADSDEDAAFDAHHEKVKAEASSSKAPAAPVRAVGR